MRLLQWGTLLVLFFIVIGVVVSYPTLRKGVFAPVLAVQTTSNEIVANDASAQAQQPASPTLSSTVTPPPFPTVPATSTSAPTALLIIAPTPTKQSSQAIALTSSTLMPVEVAIPAAIATTSLLPVSITAVPSTLVTQHTPTATSTPTGTPINTIAASLLNGTLPCVTKGGVPCTSDAGDEQEAERTGVPAVAIEVPAALPATPDIVVVVTTTSAITVTEAATTSAPTITPSPLTPNVVIPGVTGPVANSTSPLYSAPDLASAVVGQVTVGEQLTIIGWYTEGTWYLLANGFWIPGGAVNNAPLSLPLVFPTPTFTPSPTATTTPTPLPTETPIAADTPTPTPTSLEQPVCDCSGDTYDCLGNIFANRAESQRCFEYCFRQTGLDIHLLDPNLNGLACENLP
jgi:hypothetical protein